MHQTTGNNMICLLDVVYLFHELYIFQNVIQSRLLCSSSHDITLTDESSQQHFLEVLTVKLKGCSINRWCFLKCSAVS